MTFNRGDKVKMLYGNEYHIGEVTIPGAIQSKVMFEYQNDREPDYWYYPNNELELVKNEQKDKAAEGK